MAGRSIISNTWLHAKNDFECSRNKTKLLEKFVLELKGVTTHERSSCFYAREIFANDTYFLDKLSRIQMLGKKMSYIQ